MSRMDADESPEGAAPKETPGGSPGNTHETEKPCKGDPVPEADGRARSRVAPTGLVGFSALPQVSTWGFKEGRPDGGFSKRGRIFKSPEGAKLVSVGQANLFAQPYENHTEKCALQERD